MFDLTGVILFADLAATLKCAKKDSFVGPCPFCGERDGFYVRPRTPYGGCWRCLKCHPEWSGVIDFVIRRDKCSFGDALVTLGVGDQMPSNWRCAMKIADTLGEIDAKPKRLLRRLIETCGPCFAQGLLEITERIEARGGMMVNDGSRRRTSGGVFFKLAKQRMTTEQRRLVFWPRDGQRDQRAMALEALKAAQNRGIMNL